MSYYNTNKENNNFDLENNIIYLDINLDVY